MEVTDSFWEYWKTASQNQIKCIVSCCNSRDIINNIKFLSIIFGSNQRTKHNFKTILWWKYVCDESVYYKRAYIYYLRVKYNKYINKLKPFWLVWSMFKNVHFVIFKNIYWVLVLYYTLFNWYCIPSDIIILYENRRMWLLNKSVHIHNYKIFVLFYV